jgi:ATP-dependent DNA helicase RecQ
MSRQIRAMNSPLLWLDLETTPHQQVLKLGALLGDHRIQAHSPKAVANAWRELDRLAETAVAVAGHNVWEHDLPVLARVFPGLKLHALPVIDTLPFSTLCFPENPYHRLVKDYKLTSVSINDSLADAELAATLWEDEQKSLAGMAQAHPRFYQVLRTLIAVGPARIDQGARIALNALPLDLLPESTLKHSIWTLFQSELCRTAFASFVLPTPDQTSARWALAHVLSWLRVAGGISVLPPWVRHRHPETVAWLSAWRDTPCTDAACRWCRQTHHPETQLQRYFGFDTFRPAPPAADGSSLQRAITLAGMRNEPLLAILPTGGGKSLAFQLPALLRHHRRGQLTIVISPLQALMKDQVDGLVRRTGLQNVAALYGLLTLPERGDVLRRITMGDIALLYLSPEQLRSLRVQRALAQREIGCWVFDEAHCLSKWGHDFRTDYLYAARFIRELALRQQTPIPTIAGFTATAKQEVIDELLHHFKTQTSTELVRYGAENQRENLFFHVQTVGPHNKLQRIHELLGERLDPAQPAGSAVVFRAQRRFTEETAEFLRQKGWRTDYFHAGLTAPEKKRIQDAFLDGHLQVICATNAFGMGIDKEDVRVVIHGDTPGSIENYLQEAGRAGRDQHPADCILLYNEDDLEEQFRIGAFTRLSRKDIAQILRGLRTASNRRKQEEVVITTGEILRDDELDLDIDATDHSADNRVRAALSWLERAGFVERNENRTHVIQARLLVRNMQEAETKLAGLYLPESEAGLWRAVLQQLMSAENINSIAVDEIALLPEFRRFLERQKHDANVQLRERLSEEYVSAKVLKVLHAMNQANLIQKDTLMTAYVHYKVANHSGIRLQRTREMEAALLGVLEELEPDPEGWLPLSTRLLADKLQQQNMNATPELVRKLLHSLGEDGRGFAAHTGSLEMRATGRDQYRVRILRSWAQIKDLAQRRNRVSAHILDLLFEKIEADTPPRNDILVAFAFEEIETRLKTDRALYAEIKDVLMAIERGLLFLHEQQIVVLQQGLSIFRSAMTVRVLPDQRSRSYTAQDYEPLDHFYRERVFQVHVMNDYAKRGLQAIEEALRLVVSYFSMSKESFLQNFFSGKREWLDRATTERSYRRIVDELADKAQIRIVTQSLRKNLLVLAGPGSGKTRVVVHRCAYLLRVQRVKPKSILVCCFNHKAAVELRRRLNELAGADARGVTVQTYHSLALRLLGRSCPTDTEPDFDQLIRDAVAVLNGEVVPDGMEADEVRDRLLAGYEHILVDEYQDIDEPQYELISAIAGRSLEEERKLNILAVGDDDQNIYTFRGANVSFIKRFQNDYTADIAYLTDNYRSTRYIIETANQLIAHNRDRMKTAHPICINKARELLPAGGLFGAQCPETRGRVRIIRVRDIADQAVAVLDTIEHLRAQGVTNWRDIAVLARHRADLAYIRAHAEARGIPVAWPLEHRNIPPLHRFRDIRDFIDRWREEPLATLTADEALAEVEVLRQRQPDNPWLPLLDAILQDWKLEVGEDPATRATLLDFVYESLAQRRRDEQWGHGIWLNTVHAAKGTEFPHVCLCGAWGTAHPHQKEEERRVFYVGCTRARETLTLFNRADRPNPFIRECTGTSTVECDHAGHTPPAPVTLYDARLTPLEDFFLDYAGRLPSTHPIHTALAQLQPGHTLQATMVQDRIALCNQAGVTVARFSESGCRKWASQLSRIIGIHVLTNHVRYRTDVQDPAYAARIVTPRWEIPLCEIRVEK